MESMYHFWDGLRSLHSSNPPRKGDGKIAEGQGHSVGKGDTVSLGIFSSWVVANVITVTFNYIFVIVFLFPLNVGVGPCFHCTVLVPVYRVYTSCFHITHVSSCYRLHTLLSSRRCYFSFQSEHVVLIYREMCQELMRECTHTI